MDYQAAYVLLFNAITDALREMEKVKVITREMGRGMHILIKAQRAAEERYIESEEK